MEGKFRSILSIVLPLSLNNKLSIRRSRLTITEMVSFHARLLLAQRFGQRLETSCATHRMLSESESEGPVFLLATHIHHPERSFRYCCVNFCHCMPSSSRESFAVRRLDEFFCGEPPKIIRNTFRLSFTRVTASPRVLSLTVDSFFGKVPTNEKRFVPIFSSALDLHRLSMFSSPHSAVFHSFPSYLEAWYLRSRGSNVSATAWIVAWLKQLSSPNAIEKSLRK